MTALGLPPLTAPSCSRALAGAALGRAALALVALAALALPVLAAPVLKGDLVARRDVITLGELVEGAPADLARQPVFRAPALGRTGTIQAARIVEAAHALGLDGIETGGRMQIAVERAARRIGVAEIEAVVREALAARTGADAKATAIAFEGAMPALVVPPDLTDPLTVVDLAHDIRSKRVSALVAVGAAEVRASLRVSGTAIETVEVAVLAKALARGDTVAAGDVQAERRPRDAAPADAASDAEKLVGQVAKRPLAAGSVVRAGDMSRPEIVLRGEPVLIVFEAPGMSLTLRGRATESGALGDAVAVLNPASKKTLQATVTGPGRVSVGPAMLGRLAAR